MGRALWMMLLLASCEPPLQVDVRMAQPGEVPWDPSRDVISTAPLCPLSGPPIRALFEPIVAFVRREHLLARIGVDDPMAPAMIEQPTSSGPAIVVDPRARVGMLEVGNFVGWGSTSIIYCLYVHRTGDRVLVLADERFSVISRKVSPSLPVAAIRP